MTFKLLRLPFLAQTEVLKSIDLNEIFTMSICSSRIYKIIKSMNLKIIDIRYVADGNELKVFVRNILEDDELLVTLKTNPLFEDEDWTNLLIIGGSKFKYIWKNYNIESFGAEPDEFQLAISSHINRLFKFSSKIELQLSPSIISLKRFPNIKNVTDTSISDKKHVVEANTIEQIMEKYPNQKSITIKGDIVGHFEESSSIFHVKDVCFHSGQENGPMLVENFTGRFAIMYNIFLERSAVSFLIEKWMSGEKYNELKGLFVFGSGPYFPVEEIEEDYLSRGLAKRWDPSERPRSWETISRIVGHGRKKPFVLDCSSYLDVKRTTDKKRASFALSIFQFHFVVWN